MKLVVCTVVLSLAGAALGCGGAMPPVDLLASTQGAIRGAEEAGARKDPKAALHLKLAEEELAAAKELMDDDENEQAQLKLNRAAADAELAHALAEKAASVAEASEAVEHLQKLEKEDK